MHADETCSIWGFDAADQKEWKLISTFSNSLAALEHKLISLENSVPKLHEQRAVAIWILEGNPNEKNRMAVDSITQKLIAISHRVQTKMENN